ncbi:E3 ubiquitin-protein ligase RNF170-like [Watersipora subatra]|uniref:E3 ubiquitin-protein ligase RNF170-like n=1 Tax=Watersipora subatra TaxID=2589382 RepID=UPI00355ADD0B
MFEIKDVVEGISNEVLCSSILFGIVVILTLCKIRRLLYSGPLPIHPESEEIITETRQQLHANSPVPLSSTQHDRSNPCPVCLDAIRYGLETNCGHLFCGNCVITYWRTGRWTGPVACPNCRQTVTILLNAFTASELQEENSEIKNMILEETRNYNRRFSGEPRTIWEYLQDTPAILRHALYDLVSVSGMVLIFRLRILLCLFVVVIYFIVPFDLLPEGALGLLGFIDDLFIFLIAAIYITVIYRTYLANRAAGVPGHAM